MCFSHHKTQFWVNCFNRIRQYSLPPPGFYLMLKSVTRVSEVTPYFRQNLLIDSSSPHAPTSSHLWTSPAELCWTRRWIRRHQRIWRHVSAWIRFAFQKILWKRFCYEQQVGYWIFANWVLPFGTDGPTKTDEFLENSICILQILFSQWIAPVTKK